MYLSECIYIVFDFSPRSKFYDHFIHTTLFFIIVLSDKVSLVTYYFYIDILLFFLPFTTYHPNVPKL